MNMDLNSYTSSLTDSFRSVKRVFTQPRSSDFFVQPTTRYSTHASYFTTHFDALTWWHMKDHSKSFIINLITELTIAGASPQLPGGLARTQWYWTCPTSKSKCPCAKCFSFYHIFSIRMYNSRLPFFARSVSLHTYEYVSTYTYNFPFFFSRKAAEILHHTFSIVTL